MPTSPAEDYTLTLTGLPERLTSERRLKEILERELDMEAGAFASFVLRVARCVEDHHALPHDSPLLKDSCVRQAVLDK